MKKVLIITYYWPPSAGGGVQRWQKFAKHLPEFDWEPVVFTPSNPAFELKDNSLLDEVSHIETLKFPIKEPLRLFNKLSASKGGLAQGQVLESPKPSLFKSLAIWLRGNVFVPDPRVFWVKPAAEYLLDIWDSNAFDAVITTGPPHSIHLIGKKLKEKKGVIWLADFRDPWSKWDLLPKMKTGKLAMKIHRRQERSVLSSADYVLTVSEQWKKEFHELGAKKVEVITNGFDQKDFQGLTFSTPENFQIAHLGMINEMRPTKPFLEAVKSLAKENKLFAKKVRLFFAGLLNDELTAQITQDAFLSKISTLSEYMPHDQLLSVYNTSALLLLLQNKSDNAAGHIPGKIFEYLATCRPILGLGDPTSDSAQILKTCEAGKFVSYNDADGIKTYLEQEFKLFTENQLFENQDIERFERRQLTKRLADLLQSLSPGKQFSE